MIEALIREIKLVLKEIRHERKEQRLNQNQIKKIMSAIQDLTVSINQTTEAGVLLTEAINNAIAQLGSPPGTDAQLVALKATVDSQNVQIADLTNRLNAALSPGVPVVTTQPSSQSVATGGSATFITVASGSGSLTYQWQLNGGDLPGETNANLTVANAQTVNAGDYTVKVTNENGSAISAPATLIVA